MDRIITSRPGIGTTATITQRQPLRFSRVTTAVPVLIVVQHGRKELKAPGFECVLEAGEAVAMGQGQVIDIINTPGRDGHYQAEWLVWDRSLMVEYRQRVSASQPIEIAQPLGIVSPEFSKSIGAALDAIHHTDTVPDAIARHRLDEVLVWIEALGGHFVHNEPKSLQAIIRRHVMTQPDFEWTAREVANRLAMSEATLRRRLAADGTTLGAVVADMRMSFAMQLVQSTDLPISAIALDVGYESSSRFAIRFRQRFGFPPSAIRGHQRSYSNGRQAPQTQHEFQKTDPT